MSPIRSLMPTRPVTTRRRAPGGERSAPLRFAATFAATLAAALSTPLALAAPTLQAPDEIIDLLRPHLPAEAIAPQRLRAQLAEILATEGYFSPDIAIEGEEESQQLRIAPGPRTRIANVSLTVDGPVEAKKRAALLAGWRLPVGQPFRQADWNTAKQDILSQLLAEDHPAARLLDSQALIEPYTEPGVLPGVESGTGSAPGPGTGPDAESGAGSDAGSGSRPDGGSEGDAGPTAAPASPGAARGGPYAARLRAHYDAGPRYRFGPLIGEGLHRYPASLPARYNRRARAGEPYRAADLAALQSALQATPYFSSVQASLDLESASPNPDGSLSAPVRLQLRERAPHRLAFGGGLSSNTGARVEANLQTADLFGEAWPLNSGLRLEQKKQTAYGDLFLPPDDRARQDSLGVMAENTDIQGLRTERLAFGAQRVQQRGSIEQRLALNWQQETRWPDAAQAVTSRALIPNVTWTWRHLDDPLDPQSGSQLQLSLGGGSKAALSDQDFVRLYLRGQYYQPLGRRNTLLLRGELGSTFADSRRHIPQDYLFRAGGTGSVRGYAYQSLGLREGQAVVGGRYLAVASAEATHWLDEAWGVAVFVDAGDAVDALDNGRLAVGYGLGARWRSPAGPLGIDLAYGERKRELHLHFALSIPF